MKRRAAPVIAALALAITMLTATPAHAAFGYTITLPHGNAATFFSPFSGPATIKITWSSLNDPNEDFTFRLRQGGSTISQEVHHVDTPGSSGQATFNFQWPAQSVSSSTTYEVVIIRDGNEVRSRTFTLKPHLVRIVSIDPNPFFPRVVNGYRDTTNITYRLEATSNPVVIDIFGAAGGGGCCGTQVRHKVLSNVVVGTRHFIWNGKDDSGAKVPVGKYFVRITATAFTGQTQSSANAPVRVALYRRVLRSVVQNGDAFDRRGGIARLRPGGGCTVARDSVHRDALISCHDAAVKVFWQWTLPNSARIQNVSFAMVGVPGFTCRSTKGFTRPDSWLRSGRVGQSRCRVDKARLSYTYLRPS